MEFGHLVTWSVGLRVSHAAMRTPLLDWLSLTGTQSKVSDIYDLVPLLLPFEGHLDCHHLERARSDAWPRGLLNLLRLELSFTTSRPLLPRLRAHMRGHFGIHVWRVSLLRDLTPRSGLKDGCNSVPSLLWESFLELTLDGPNAL